MIPIPIPDVMAETLGGVRQVIGVPGDPTGDVRPCEYLVSPSDVYPGRPCMRALVALDDYDRAIIAAGGDLLLTMEGGEVPWALQAVRFGG